jgi:hypothetical protein
MRDEQILSSRARAPVGELWEAGGVWQAQSTREPELDELLDDPIMTLLWKGDRLEPSSARATVMELQQLLRRRQGSGRLPAAA